MKAPAGLSAKAGPPGTTLADLIPCEVCGRSGAPGRVHPCRFDKACTCWRGIPCQPTADRRRRCALFGDSALSEDTEVVVFLWSNRFGRCYECGSPAAYAISGQADPESLRCSVCAAQAASEGETIAYLFKED